MWCSDIFPTDTFPAAATTFLKKYECLLLAERIGNIALSSAMTLVIDFWVVRSRSSGCVLQFSVLRRNVSRKNVVVPQRSFVADSHSKVAPVVIK